MGRGRSGGGHGQWVVSAGGRVEGTSSNGAVVHVSPHPVVGGDAVKSDPLRDVRFEERADELGQTGRENIFHSRTKVPLPGQLVFEQLLEVGIVKGHGGVDHDVEDYPHGPHVCQLWIVGRPTHHLRSCVSCRPAVGLTQDSLPCITIIKEFNNTKGYQFIWRVLSLP